MVRTKELAEFQFDASAAPISLGVKFDNFCAFELNSRILEDDVDEITGYDLFSDEIDDLPIESPNLALIANDLDPEQRDLEFEKIQNLTEDVEFDELKNQLSQKDFSKVKFSKVDSIDFKIKHSQVKRELEELRPDNKVTTAFRLISLAIDKLSDEQKEAFDLENTVEDRNYYHGLALIDKSMSSIKFINHLGKRIMNQFITQFPERYKQFPNDDELIIDWLNKENRLNNQLDFIFTNAYIGSKLKFSNIETNDNPGFNLKLKNFSFLKCHQILRILHLHTISLNSTRFRNIDKFIKKFSLHFGGQRLFYLEHLISEANKGYLFFESHEDNFSQLDLKWKNPFFPYYDMEFLFKLSEIDLKNLVPSN